MNVAQRRAKIHRSRFSLFLVLSCLIFSGCEDPGLVGGGFTETNTRIQVDTVQVNGVEAQQLIYYSGGLTYFSAGRFNDPAFGDLQAVGLIRPGLPGSDDAVIEDDANVKLRLFFDQSFVYGDSLATAEFDVIELDQIWRGKTWQINDSVRLSGNSPVASFSIDEQDSIDVTLSNSWVQSYRPYFENEEDSRDSLYRIEFPGLALVPRNSSKIIPFEAGECRLVIENTENDTLELPLNDWAYSLQRLNQQNAPAGTFKLHSTLEQVISFDMGLTRDSLGAVNLARVELVLYENKEALISSLDQVSSTAQRPPVSTPVLHLVEPEFVPIVLDRGSALSEGGYNEDDGSYRFNLTNFANSVILDGIRPELKFYMMLDENNGIIRSSLLYNDQAPPGKQPQLIVTSVETQDS